MNFICQNKKLKLKLSYEQNIKKVQIKKSSMHIKQYEKYT